MGKKVGKPKGKLGRLAADVFEAEQEEAEETKNKIVNRYDKVDNYEYELPSDFEDDEISEDEAFNAEDEEMFGKFFNKGKNKFSNKSDSHKGELEDELDVSEGDDLEEDEEDEDDDDDENDDDVEAYENMMKQVTGLSKAKSTKTSQNQVLSEAYEESEFNLNPGAGTGSDVASHLSVDALLESLGRSPGTGALKKKLTRVQTKEASLSAPLPGAVAERVARKAGYELSAKEVGRWQDLVKHNRLQPTLNFTGGSKAARGEVPRPTTASWTATFTPKTDLEKEVAAMLEAGGAQSDRKVAEGEELAMKQLSVEEALERRAKLRKLRTLMFKHELKAKHLRKIKSRTFHKLNKKAKERKEGKSGMEEGGGAEDREEVRAMAVKQEWARARERLTLKHRNTSRWASRILKKGLQLHQDGTKEAIAEQLRKGSELSRKMSTLRELGSDEDEDEDTQEEDTEEESIGEDTEDEDEDEDTARDKARQKEKGKKKKALDKMRAQAEGVLAGTLTDPQEGDQNQGIFALPFMVRAMEKQKKQSEREARQLLEELDKMDTEDQLNSGEDDDDGNDDDDEEDEAGVNVGKKRFRQSFEAGKPVKTAGGDSDDENEDNGNSDENDDDETSQQERGGRKEGAQKKIGGKKAKKSKRAREANQQEEEDENIQDVELNEAGQVKEVEGTAGQSVRLSGPLAVNMPSKSKKRSKTNDSKETEEEWVLESVPTPFQVGDQTEPSGGDSSVHFRAGLFEQHEIAANGSRDSAGSKAAESKKVPVRVAGMVGAKNEKGTEEASTVRRSGGEESDDEDERRGGRGEKVDDAADGGSSSDEEAEMNTQAGVSQRALIAAAFAGDDVAAEFTAEKEKEVAGEVPAAEGPVLLPGWGAWQGQQKEPAWAKKKRQDQEKARAAALKARKDADLKHVHICEKVDKKAGKYNAPQLPFPFTSKEAFDRSLRLPLGRDFNTDKSFRDMTRPQILKSNGRIIEPIKFSNVASKERRATERSHNKDSKRARH